MNGITYFRLKSQYEGDYTKNCALSGSEVDGNFYTLEGRDIKSVYVDNGKVVINLMNGDKLSTDNITEGCVKNLEIDFDEINGVLTITANGEKQTITGFATNYNIGDAISVDGSLIGNGLAKSPVGLSPVVKTGHYKPVKGFIKVSEGEKLPIGSCVFPGDRFLTQETVNGFGLLYDYEAVKKIACALKEQHSEWRIPTKDDWDDMLNAVEPCEDFRNHESSTANKYLGHYAGKYLKSVEGWKKDNDCNVVDDNDEKTCIEYNDCCDHHKHHKDHCHETYCGEYGSCHHQHKHTNDGLGKYGFNVLPAGMADDGRNYSFFKERAYFWTATNSEYRNAYVKCFIYNKSSVLQDVLASGNYLSLRLVKDFKGDNYNEREDILGGVYSTVIMPSLKNGSSIWTNVNISLTSCGCDCHSIIPNNNQGIDNFDETKYFINEWNGKEWIRKEVLDGESVVLVREEKLLGGKRAKIYTELRHENGKLKNVAQSVVDNVKFLFKDEIRNINGRIDDIEDRLNTSVSSLTKSINEINSEIEDLNKQVSENTTSIQGEIERATDKEKELEDAIQQNAKDIKDLEEATNSNLDGLRTDLDEEIKRAKEAEEGLDTKTDGIERKFDEKISEIEGKLLTEDGTVFDVNTGKLTLKSNKGTNDITVQFNMNFGEF